LNSIETFRRHIEAIGAREHELAKLAQFADRLRAEDAAMHSLSMIERHLIEQDIWLSVRRRMPSLDNNVFDVMERQVAQYAQMERRLREIAERERMFAGTISQSLLVEKMLLPRLACQSPNETTAKPRVELPPGSRMMALASLLFSRRTVERVIDPLVADYRHEMFEAMLRDGADARLGMIRARYWLAFIFSALEIAASAFGRVWRALKGS
jgi:nicotinamide mononucleotide adenylyltransferase